MTKYILPVLMAMIFAPLATPARADCVVVLHGLLRGPASMTLLEVSLQQAGYRTVNNGYPSTELPFEELVELAVSKSVAECGEEKTHFVTHSLGGILTRAWLEHNRPEDMGRVVMLGPPNQGSEIVDVLGDVPGFAFINGPMGQALGTDEESVPNTIGVPLVEIGVIAGNRSLNPVYSSLIEGPDDGKVSVASTRLPGLTDHIVLPVTHTFMMNDIKVIGQTLEFLDKGRFDPELSYREILKTVTE